MNQTSPRIIDIFCHILPKKYKDLLFKKAKPCYYLEADLARPALFDLDARFRVMDKFQGLRQVLTVGAPPVEYVVSPEDAVDLARISNDGMAELLNKYPDRFAAAAASLPMTNVDAALLEAERAIKDLHFKGVQLYSSINGKPLDRPEFMPFFEMMAEFDLPIWIHPARDISQPDYPGEEASRYHLFVRIGWPYETSLAMARLVFSGVLERYPNIKFIAHHCGAMIPFFEQRIATGGPAGVGGGGGTNISKPPLDYFKKFYADTVLSGSVPALMCGYAFFGADQLLFGSDYPYPGGAEKGDLALGKMIESVENMHVPEMVKEKIFSKNAERILHLT
jgi:aminocarboxymuconate-semialdehyde decarboxylase